MKRFLAIISVVCGIWSGAAAQNITIAKGEPGKWMDEESVQNAWYLGRHGEHDCWLTRTEDGPKSFVRSDDWQVVEVDRNLRVLGRLELPMSRMCKVVTARLVDGTADVVLVDSSETKSVTILRAGVVLDSMKLVDNKIDTLLQYEKTPTDRSYVWGAVSENGDYMGVLMLLQMTKKLQYSAEALMFDENMEQIWRKEYGVGTTSSIAVSNDGEMITLGYEEVSDGERITINVITSRSGDTYGLTMSCDRIKDMQILNVVGRKVLCGGLFSPRDSNPKDRMVGGTVSMAFDMDSMSVTKFVMHPFQNEDMNILLNKKTKKVQRSQMTPMVSPLAYVRMPYGAVLAVGHRHVMHYMNANGTVSTSHYTQGIHLVAMDESGNVMWTRNVRRNDMQKNMDDKLYIALFAKGDTVCLVKSEHPKYPGSYDIAKDAKELEMGDKNNLVLYAVSAVGDVKKTVLEQKTKHSLVSAAKRENGDIVMLTLDGSKSRMVEMKIE